MSTYTHIRTVMCVALGAIAITPATASASDAISITQWNKVAQRTAISVARQFQAQSMVHIAYVQAAVYDAVVAIEGSYAPYGPPLDPRPGAAVDAAVAVAAHDVLVAHFPSQQSTLDADLANALDAIGDGTEKESGIEVGRQAAAQLLALRASSVRLRSSAAPTGRPTTTRSGDSAHATARSAPPSRRRSRASGRPTRSSSTTRPSRRSPGNAASPPSTRPGCTRWATWSAPTP